MRANTNENIVVSFSHIIVKIKRNFNIMGKLCYLLILPLKIMQQFETTCMLDEKINQNSGFIHFVKLH